MTDANEMCESVMLELKKLVLHDTDETTEEQQRLSCHEETASDDFPASLLSYFETSKSRAAACEKFILEELEDFTASHHTDGAINLHNGLNKDMMKLNEQNVYKTENEMNKSGDRLYHALAEIQTLSAHSVPLSANIEARGTDGATEEFLDNENDLVLKISEYEAEREKRHCEDMQEKEQRRQREMDFQEELRKIMETEKLHQMELEVMERKAQERLEQELLLQQELMSNLQRQVEQERRRIEEEQQLRKMREEEQNRKKEEEEDRRKIKEEEEKRKREEDDIRHRLEERERMEEEEKRKILERKLKEEQGRRKKEEEERKKKEEEEKRKSEEEMIENEMRKKEEERKMKEIRLQEEEKRRQVEVMKRNKEEEKRNEKEEDGTINREDKKNTKEEEEIQLKDEIRIMEKDKKMRDEEKKRREEERGITKVFEVMTKEREIKGKEVKRESDEERQKSEVQKKTMDGQIRRKEGLTMKIQTQLSRDEEKKNQGEETRHSLENKDIITKNEEDMETKEEELIERQEGDVRRYLKDKEYRDMEEKIISGQEMEGNREGNTEYEADNRKKEQNTETKDEERMQEEVKKWQEKDDMGTKEVGTRNKQTDKRHSSDMVRESVKENLKMEERMLKEDGESLKSQSKNTGNTGFHLTSQLEVNPTLTSSSSAPFPNEFTAGSASSVAAKQPDPHRNISQISFNKTINQPDHGASSCPFPACLPERTEQKRLLWMKNCTSWSKLSLQNRRKQKGSTWSCRGLTRAAEATSLPPLCPHALLQSTGWRSLHEVTMVTLEDLPACNLSTLAQCAQLRSLTLRRCGLKSLEGISQLQELCYIDLQENYISFVDCENMTSLRVLRLAHNKLTSIHGLSGADGLGVLDLSHNSITRIAGLESVHKLQRLSVDHNQLISTKGLKDVYTLLHLDCSHNHLAKVEGLENNALLHTLDLRGNSLAEPPVLKNQVLLRELHLDDNSISSLQDLTACWLPLLQHLSAAQNRITQLPPMSDFLSLENLDLSFNCLSELCNVCENLEGCQFLQEVRLMGNPLQHESGWRSTLQRAVPGLRAVDSQQTDSFLSPPAVQQVSLASGSFLTFCRAQLQQTHDLQQSHSRELSNASSPLEALKSVCRHFATTLKLAEDQRFAHEYGDTTVCDEHWLVDQIPPEKPPHMDSVIGENCTECPKMKNTNQIPAVFLSGDNIRCSNWSLEDDLATESQREAFDSVTMGAKTGPTVTKASSGSVHFFETKGKTHSFSLDKAPVLNHQDSDLKSTAAVVIQQWWRKYKGNINAPPFSEKGGERGGDGGMPESGPSYINKRAVGRNYAATVIQAFWRSFTLRRRLASALAAVQCPGDGEDDTFEEVDVDEFVFDEAALEKHWTLTLSEDSPITQYPVSEQPLSLKPLSSCLNRSQYMFPPPHVQRPKLAWVAGEHVDLAAQRISPESSNRSTPPPNTSVLSGLSERSEKIMEEWGFTDSQTALLMLKRAQKMKSKKQQQKKQRDPFVRLALLKNCNYQKAPVEARNRLTRHDGHYVKDAVGEAEFGLHQAEKTEQMKLGQRMHTQAAQSDRHSESEHFLPEINSSILSGGRVQLVADPAYADCQHHTSGLWANSTFSAQPCKVNCFPRRNSLGHARKEAPSPKRVTSAPSKKERISFRDNPVQLSGGWGGGKKRDRVCK